MILRSLLQILPQKQKYIFFSIITLSAIVGIFETGSVIVVASLITVLLGGELSGLSSTFLHEYWSLDRRGFIVPAILFLIIGGLGSVVLVRAYTRFSAELGVDLADKLFARFLSKQYSEKLKLTSGDSLVKITLETQRVVGQIVLPLIQFSTRCFLALFLIIVACISNFELALIGSVFLLLFYTGLYFAFRCRLAQAGVNLSQLQKIKLDLFSAASASFQVLMVHQASAWIYQKYTGVSPELAKSWRDMQYLATIPRPLIELGLYLAICVTAFIGLGDIDLNSELLSLTTFVIAVFKLLPALQGCYASAANIRAHQSALNNVFNDLVEIRDYGVSDSHPGLVGAGECRADTKLENLSVKDVDFSYEHLGPRFRFPNITIGGRGLILISGPSGVGKSTLLNLILGLFEARSGSIQINMRSREEWGDSWYKFFALVPQDPLIIRGSLKDNISFGSAEVDEQRMWQCLNDSGLKEFVELLPEGIEHNLVDLGQNLSGGQKQRLSIARALYRNSPILVFDEPTSALDKKTEAVIRERLKMISREKLVIVVSHTLTKISDEQIDVVLENIID